MAYELRRFLERKREIDLVRGALDGARHGQGGFLFFEGASGLGKTSLLRVARELAVDSGFQVLHASGSEFEQGFPWGVARQLLEPVLESESSESVTELWAGPAVLAESLFNYEAVNYVQNSAGQENDLHAILHGLYWLCRRISERQPLLISIDDAQWMDTPSLRFMGYLVNRLEGVSVEVALTNSPTERTDSQDLLAAACSSPNTKFARLQPLSMHSVREMCTERLACEPHESFVRACHAITEGNPLYLLALLEDAVSHGIEPREGAIPRLRELSPRRLSLNVLRSMNRLPDTAVEMAGAIAVLGADAEPRHCATVAGLEDSDAVAMAGRLRDARILRHGVPYTFLRPIVRQVVYAEMSAQARHAAHYRAARSLMGTVAVTTAADHLCRTEPAADPWVSSVLRTAARKAIQSLERRDAVRYLHRALAEPPSEEESPRVLAELGAAELRSREPSAVEHLLEALWRTTDRELQREVRLDLGQALAASGRNVEAVDVLSDLDAALGPDTCPADRHARAFASLLTYLTGGRDAVPTTGLSCMRAGGPFRGHAAAEALRRNVPAHRVARLAVSATAHAPEAAEQDVELPERAVAAWVLMHCDRYHEAETVLSELVQHATEGGQVLAATTAQGMLSALLLVTGRLDEAEAAARRILRGHDPASLAIAGVPLAAATLVQSLVETDRVKEAAELLEQLGMANELPESLTYLSLRQARGRLRIVQGMLEEGTQELLECHRLATDRGWDHPGAGPGYLADVAHGLMRLGDSDAGSRLAHDEVARARAFGAALPLAVALRTCGELRGGKAGLDQLEEADALLSGQPQVIERPRTLLSLGAALRRAGHRSAALNGSAPPSSLPDATGRHGSRRSLMRNCAWPGEHDTSTAARGNNSPRRSGALWRRRPAA